MIRAKWHRPRQKGEEHEGAGKFRMPVYSHVYCFSQPLAAGGALV